MAAVDSVSPLIKSVGIAAAVLGIVQGIVWIILTLLAALIYLEAWTPLEKAETYGQTLSSLIMLVYLNVDIGNPLADVYITPEIFFGWTILYFIMSIIWIVISAVQLTGIIQEQGSKTLRTAFISWATWTSIICVCDLILTSLLAADYDATVTKLNKEPTQIFLLLPLACGIVMSLAARGFTLWIVNITFVIIILKLTKSSLNAYNSNNNTNTFNQSKPPNRGFNNPAYSWSDEQRPNFNRNDSYSTPYSRDGPETFPKLPPISSTSERLAKIGKQSSRSPPQNVAPPRVPQYIYPTQPRVPSPDYSPPNSPFQSQLKPALKSRPQNAFDYTNRY